MSASPQASANRGHPMIKLGEALPRLSFPQSGAPGRVSWNTGTLAAVVFVPHGGNCPGCAEYLAQLGEAVGGLRDWATRAMVLLPGGAAMTLEPGVLMLFDDGGAGRAQLGVGENQAAVIQCDRWGAVYEVGVVESGELSHGALPDARDLVALSQFIDIQCPECGVPSKEWLSASPFPLG